MERTSIAAQVRLYFIAMLASFLTSTGHCATSGEDLALDLRGNVVRVSAPWENGASYDGFGFIVGERSGFVYIVTADHIVRGDAADRISRSPSVTFSQDVGTEHKAELLATRLQPGEGDIAVLRVRSPAALGWRRDIVSSAGVRRRTQVWFIGLERDWFVPIQPGMVNRVEPAGTIIAEGLNVKVGTSGAPLISDSGVVGMVVVDAGAYVRSTPIDLIERALKDWNYPWQLSSAPPPVLECDRRAAAPADTGRNSDVPGVEFDKIDAAKAVEACTEAMKTYPQSPRFAFQLGRANSSAKKHVDALYWYRFAAERNYSSAQYNLALLYANGDGGLQKNEAEAARLYRLAADQGHASAQANLGYMYRSGLGGLAKDDAQAVRLYRLAADKGNAIAQSNLGYMYRNGLGGLTKDDAQAVRLYRLAADQGNTSAQVNLGVMHREGLGGLAKDDAQAARLYRLAADKGNAAGQANLGGMYRDGLGGLAKDDMQALRLYRLAADQGNATAQTSVGNMYSQGLGGLAKDDTHAVRFYRLAADQGNAFAQVNLGVKYEQGTGGLAKDDSQAVRLYRLAADQGNAGAQYYLGGAYEQGRGGIGRDLNEAKRLYRLSSTQGYEPAKNALKRLGE
jgi:TPR repeat protein